MTYSAVIRNGTSWLRINRFLSRTQAEGPGLRAVVWVQGCPIRCPGCFNKETWDPGHGRLIHVHTLFELIKDEEGLEGVTFAGGEPFQQAESLARLAAMCREEGLSIITFSGYSYSALRNANRPDWDALLAMTDLLLAGPYIASKQDFSRPWVGSANQEFVFLTPRYRFLESILEELPNKLELSVNDEGIVSLNGMAPEASIDTLVRNLGELGLGLVRTQKLKKRNEQP